MKNLTKYILISSFLTSFSFAHSDGVICQLVENHVTLESRDALSKNPYDNGYKEERYHKVLDQFIKTFNPEFVARGEELKILRDWGDGAVNAWAFRIGSESWLEVPGGMSRYHLISETGFLMTICHELGHLLAGSPHRYNISFEGQADYYAPMKCMEKILDDLEIVESLMVNSVEDSVNCVGTYCNERYEGIKSLTSYYAFLERAATPSLQTPSRTRVSQTISAHPPAQCRFDTMIKGLTCTNRDNFSYSNEEQGACNGESSRPACWFKSSL